MTGCTHRRHIHRRCIWRRCTTTRWKINRKHRPLLLITFHLYSSTMHFYKSFHQSKTDTGSGMMHIYLIKPVKDATDMLRRNQATGIGYGKTEKRLSFLFQRKMTDVHLPILRSKLKGIGKKIEINTFQLLYISLGTIVCIRHMIERKTNMFLTCCRLKRFVPVFKALQ